MCGCLRCFVAVCFVAVRFVDCLHGATLTDDDAKVTADQAVREALEFGIAGDLEERNAKLANAIARDPDCELARWHLGQLRWADRWLSVSEVEVALGGDESQQAYLRKRDALTGGDAKQQLDLARWCAAQQLTDVAEFHFHQVLQNPTCTDSRRDEALRRLGLRSYHGAWLTSEQIEEFERQTEAKERAAKKWTGRVQRWTRTLGRGNRKQVQFARKQMDEVDDLAIIPLLQQHMSAAGEAQASEVVDWLARHPQQEATESLLNHALDAPWKSVNQAAIDALASRPLHDFVPQLLGQLVPPIESRFSVRLSPLGGVIHQHEIYRAGRAANDVARADFFGFAWRPTVNSGWYFRSPATPSSRYSVSVSRWGPDGGKKRLSFEEQAQEAVEIRQRMQWLWLEASLRTEMIEQNIGQANQWVAAHNGPIFSVLEGTTDAQVPFDPELWWDWWEIYNEEYSPPKNTRYSYGYRREFRGPTYEIIIARMSCFAAGTWVRTDSGLRRIEAVQPGHRVLSQDVDSGELLFKLVNATTERPAAPQLEIIVGDTSIFATKGHPFWVNGKGWRMAKRLVVGDILHTINGPRSVQQIDARAPAPAHNLVVDDFSTYFVGKAGVLAHDNQPRQPTLALTPGFAGE